ncbi:MAG: hypothetical protein K6E58_00590 [Eubacterium sp.]|nr:hypothetical protein [Eubacterium sp.]
MGEEIRRGKLYIFTSYTPGAGKSYRMVATACENEEAVMVGFLNSAHRDMTKLLKDYDIAIDDFSKYSVNGILAENPDAVIFDELGMLSRNKDSRRLRKKQGNKESKRDTFIYNDIDTILDAGINVYASANLKRFESANPVFKAITGIGVKTKVPDKYLEDADSIIFVDRKPELMIEDYENGTLFVDKYMKSKIMQKNFLPETLTKYREASLKYLEQFGDKVEIVYRSGEEQ